jgi:YidC/Oxa1 family membrane protein insertase
MWDTIIIQPMVNVLIFIYYLIGNNFGIAIILFTILIRLITWPLNAQQMKGAQAMQELQSDKEWQDIQKKYAKDKEKLSQEQMRIYKVSKHHSRAGRHAAQSFATFPFALSVSKHRKRYST